ncbi:hypothetical protein A176_002047 [Myxococcus hansupus]|uniref:Uncharacterized protein n=1 Tax=Pseudomyxococcus hansupus TaxID=1297742 RepID=A0A0H4WUZ5_9BACT|nr:hypothetical protein A176_002047 [Myxococcus hansupus]
MSRPLGAAAKSMSANPGASTRNEGQAGVVWVAFPEPGQRNPKAAGLPFYGGSLEATLRSAPTGRART